MCVRGGGWGGGEGEGEKGRGRRQERGGERVERRGQNGAGKVGRAGEEEREYFSVCTLKWDVQGKVE